MGHRRHLSSVPALDVRSFRELRRAFGATLPEATTGFGDDLLLDMGALPADPPRLEVCEVIEGSETRVRSHRLSSVAETAFVAFLDGVQESRVAGYVNGVPVVGARVAAVIRSRVDRRMITWGPGARARLRLYAPRALLPEAAWSRLQRAGLSMVDTLEAGAPTDAPLHPGEMLRRALQRVKDDREGVERDLAELWCESAEVPLYVDGGLPRGVRASSSPWCVGVVKSHHTLYAVNDDLRTVMTLPFETRSSVFRVHRSRRPDVASWYLRLRDAQGHDPMWGLVRVEVAFAEDTAGQPALASRADTISRWILSERSPVSLPDRRWDRMAYGIRDCEAYLRAVRVRG